MRRKPSLRHLFLASVLLASALLVGSGPATAQSDCTQTCWDGFFDYVYLKCVPWSPTNCTGCHTECPGNGPPDGPENKG